MKKKFFAMALAAALMVTAGCGENKQSSVAPREDATPVGDVFTDEEALEELLQNCQYITRDMYDRAIAFSKGDLTRLAAVMRKAEAGEPITIGMIGGSITVGFHASDIQKESYAVLVKQWWEENFPDTEITYVNAGIGGTSSYLGVHRVEEDLLAYEPDFVIVEFSVNDGNTVFYKKTYENLVRRIMMSESEPAVMLLFMTMEDGTSAQDNDSMIGFQYGIPMISYRNAVLEEVKAGSFTWKDISPDNIHPSTRGHAIVGELFRVYLSNVYRHLDSISGDVTPFTASVVTKEAYMDAAILDNRDITPDELGSFIAKEGVNASFAYDWYTEEGDGGIVFTLDAANIGFIFQKFTDGRGGQFEVYVDGVYQLTLDADFSGGWGSYGETTEVYTSAEKQTHTVEVRKKENSSGNVFAILGLMVS